jgi:hypothetical protein
VRVGVFLLAARFPGQSDDEVLTATGKASPPHPDRGPFAACGCSHGSVEVSLGPPRTAVVAVRAIAAQRPARTASRLAWPERAMIVDGYPPDPGR